MRNFVWMLAAVAAAVMVQPTVAGATAAPGTEEPTTCKPSFLVDYAKRTDQLDENWIRMALRDTLTQQFSYLEKVLACHQDKASWAEFATPPETPPPAEPGAPVPQPGAPDTLSLVQRLANLRSIVSKIASTVSASTYSRARLEGDACFKEDTGADCDSRLGGFALAAYALKTTQECWVAIRDAGTKSEGFRAGYFDYWKEAGPADAKCLPPPTPVRCKIAVCWDNNRVGIGLRTAVELGGTFGSGLGFGEDRAASFQFQGTIGFRAFFLSDLIDAHGAFGIGANPSSDVEGDASFLVLALGPGFWNGLAGVHYLHTFDPFDGGRGSGNGVAIYADLGSLDRVGETVLGN
jgi:hypothetical protein